MSITKALRYISIVAPLSMLLVTPARAQSFLDTSLNVSDYSISTYVQTGTVVIANTATDGNPGAALSVSYYIPAPAPFTSDRSSNTLVATIFTFDPNTVAPGYQITFSIDKNISYTPSNIGLGNGQGFLIVQGGQMFLHAVPLSSTQGIFQNASFASVLASDFGLFDPASGAFDASVNPDFTAGAMQFGFTSSLFVPSGLPSVQAQSVYDNFSVSISVPEPGTYVLMLAGMGALIAYRRRRNAP